MAELQLGWYTVRTPNTTFYSLTERPSTLTIHGSPYNITDDESPSMLLRRQDAFEGVWHTQLDFEPSAARESAGTAVWWSKWAFASVERKLYKVLRHPILPDGSSVQFAVSVTMLSRERSFSNIPCWRMMMFTYVLG
jgi:hypothetical protein